MNKLVMLNIEQKIFFSIQKYTCIFLNNLTNKKILSIIANLNRK